MIGRVGALLRGACLCERAMPTDAAVLPRDRDDRGRELSQGSRGGLSNPRERLPLDARDVFTRDLELPRGGERERVWTRDSDVTLRGSEVRTLATVGAFRVVPAGELRDGQDRPLDPHRGDLRHLRDQGLVETIPTTGADRALVVLTERGRDVLEGNRWSIVHRDELRWEALERELVDRRDVGDERCRPREPKARQEFYGCPKRPFDPFRHAPAARADTRRAGPSRPPHGG
jgi:hypothetical protein